MYVQQAYVTDATFAKVYLAIFPAILITLVIFVTEVIELFIRKYSIISTPFLEEKSWCRILQ